jgi:hypothetical protein
LTMLLVEGTRLLLFLQCLSTFKLIKFIQSLNCLHICFAACILFIGYLKSMESPFLFVGVTGYCLMGYCGFQRSGIIQISNFMQIWILTW